MRIILTLVLCLLSGAVLAAETITFDRASAMASTVPMPAAGVSMVVTNNGSDDKIIAARSTAALNVYLQTTVVDEKGMIIANKTQSINVPGNGKSTTLNVAGEYINLIGVNKAFAAGEKFPLVLTFEKAGEKTVQVEAVTGEEFAHRFPPEALGASLEKSRVIHENTKGREVFGSWGERLRNKLRGIEPAPAPVAPHPSAPTVINGPTSTPGRPMPAPMDDSSSSQIAPAMKLVEGDDGKLQVVAPKAAPIPVIDAKTPAALPAKPAENSLVLPGQPAQ